MVTFSKLALIFTLILPSILAAPVPDPQVGFEVGGDPLGSARGGVAKREPQLDFEVGGDPVGITRGGVAKREPQLDFEVGGDPVGITRGGVAKRYPALENGAVIDSGRSYVPTRGSGSPIAEPLVV